MHGVNAGGYRNVATRLTWTMLLAVSAAIYAQDASPASPPIVPSIAQSGPIAIVPLDSKNPDAAAVVTGALEVSQGKAIIAANGTVTSGSNTTQVILPHRGVLRVCASTTVKLAADTSVPAGDTPGLLMSIDHGALEASFATGRNADILLTPDFRILIGGPGAVDMKVRLGEHGDTCVDNAGINAPYVLVTSVFGNGDYRVQPGQRVMFQRGNLNEVVDQEKEPCGCPPPIAAHSNEFPLAQSEGLAPLPTPVPVTTQQPVVSAQSAETLTYNSADHAPAPVQSAQPAASAQSAASNPAPATAAPKKKPGLFTRIGNFFRRIFGAEP
jgi:hypothetical protein